MDDDTKQALIVTTGIALPVMVFVVALFASIAWYNQGQKELAKACIEQGKNWVRLGSQDQCVGSLSDRVQK